MSGVARWLDARRPPMPPGLRSAVDAALAGARGASQAGGSEAGAAARPEPLSVADRLAEAGLGALLRVARARPDRAGAAELLAADALITYACEAAAEEGPEALDRITARLDLPGFAALLEEAGS